MILVLEPHLVTFDGVLDFSQCLISHFLHILNIDLFFIIIFITLGLALLVDVVVEVMNMKSFTSRHRRRV